MIATPQMALEAATRVARAAGLAPHILGDAIEGEARDVGKVFAGMALQVAERNQPFDAPCVLLSGGETTVTVRGRGRGGRNVEYLLSLAIALEGHSRIYALAGDTDGVDGQEEIAGPRVVAGPETDGHAREQRRSQLFFGSRRLGDHGTDADQRKRLSRHSDRARLRIQTHAPGLSLRQVEAPVQTADIVPSRRGIRISRQV
jgi:hypothetical protein